MTATCPTSGTGRPLERGNLWYQEFPRGVAT
jgi:hypothetical protein